MVNITTLTGLDVKRLKKLLKKMLTYLFAYGILYIEKKRRKKNDSKRTNQNIRKVSTRY